MDKIRIGTRGSKLALWQAEYIAELLQNGGLETGIIKIDTKGDKILDVSIAKIGSKGVFTEEIEEQLAKGTIDIAVHSAKDMQSELPDGFELIAFTEREVVNDVLVGTKENFSLEQEDLIIGTASTRRVAMLKRFYPHVKTVAVRGNLQTRIAKMKDGACDVLMLAYAGVHRMGYEGLVVHQFSSDQFVPAVGQGSIAIECATSLPAEKKDRIRRLTNHEISEYQLLAERAYLRKLQGGCSIPVFALATWQDKKLTLKGGIVSLDGSKIVQHEVNGGPESAVQLGDQLAENILHNGGDAILKAIKGQLSN